MLSMAAHRIGKRRHRGRFATNPLAQRAMSMGRRVGRNRSPPSTIRRFELKGRFWDIVEVDPTAEMAAQSGRRSFGGFHSCFAESYNYSGTRGTISGPQSLPFFKATIEKALHNRLLIGTVDIQATIEIAGKSLLSAFSKEGLLSHFGLNSFSNPRELEECRSLDFKS